MRRRTLALALLSLVVAAVALVVMLRPTSRPIVTIGYQPTAEQIAVSTGAARDFEAALPLVPASEPEAVAAATIAAALRTPSPVRPGQQETARLAEAVAKFMHAYASRDADAYAAWQRSRGAELALDKTTLEAAYRRLTGKSLPSEAPEQQVFRELFEGSLAADGAALRPQAVAAGEKGLLVVFGSQTRNEDIINAFLDTPSDSIHDRWLGQRGIAGQRHWRPPVDRSAILEKHGRVDCAWVMIGCKGARGDWYALHLDAYFDPDRQTWWIERAGVQNTYAFLIAPQF